jgi:hypothetical protein
MNANQLLIVVTKQETLIEGLKSEIANLKGVSQESEKRLLGKVAKCDDTIKELVAQVKWYPKATRQNRAMPDRSHRPR